MQRDGLIEAGVKDTDLGMLPLGTGNDAARAWGFADPMSAWAALEGGPTRRMDVIEVQCANPEGAKTRCALVYAAGGFAAEILKRTTPRVKRWAGRRGCYTIGFFASSVWLVIAAHADSM